MITAETTSSGRRRTNLLPGCSNNARLLGRLDRKIDLILKHLGIDPNQEVCPEIKELMKTGQKIQAIKLYRQQTGAGLKEAKDYVESL